MYELHCRMCFTSNNLKPIFDEQNDSDAYVNDLFLTTGVKIEKGDALSQQMCLTCINIVNTCLDFRIKCKETNEKLLELMGNAFKVEAHISSMSEDESGPEDEHNLDTMGDFIEFEGCIDDLLKRNVDIVFDNDKRHNTVNLSFTETQVEDDLVCEDDQFPKQCTKCAKMYNNRRSYAAHLRMHRVKVVCEYCGKEVHNERALAFHYKAKHGHEKTDKCRFCDYRGTKAEMVKIHERLHTGEKPYVCETCGAGFHRKSSYQQHVPLHLPEKTVKCDECPAMFKSTILMQIHKSNKHRRWKVLTKEDK